MIKIKKNPNGDTRTAPKGITFEQFQKANDMHISDVQKVMKVLSDMIYTKGQMHDFTKKSEEKMFYDNFVDTIENGTDFVNNEWYQLHVNTEKHHPLSKCHDDITLLDILEMVTDCVCAGKSRSGEVRQIEINDKILKLALDNTVKMVSNMIEVD